MSSGFYRAFEDRHRGTRETIKSRLQVYLPFVLPLREIYSDATALDLGCGRGEWLELLQEAGIASHGVDLDESMLAGCSELGLSVETTDAISMLQRLPDESQAVISGFHFAEHIAFADLHVLVRESLRILRPAGLLILETPNPENIVVGTSGFYLDPTHKRPLPPGLLAFMPENYGFHRTKVLRLQEPAWLTAETPPSLISVLRDISPDYSVVAQKSAAIELLEHFDSAFEPEYGVTLESLAARYDTYAGGRIRQAETRANDAEGIARGAQASADAVLASAQRSAAAAVLAQAQAQEALSRVEDAQARVEQIVASKSWRLTAPLRAAIEAINRVLGK